MLDLLFHATFAAFLAHELDAVAKHEWRVLPLTSFLPDAIGERVFVWLHLPIVMAVLHFGAEDGWFRIGFAGFAVAHVWLHWIYRRHPAYEFDNPGSRALILLTGVLGCAYLAAAFSA